MTEGPRIIRSAKHPGLRIAPGRAEPGITVTQVAEGVVGDLGQVELPIECQLIEGLDIFQSLGDGKIG